MPILRNLHNIFRPVSMAARGHRFSKERQFSPNYNFVFSDDIQKWMSSGQVKTKEYKNAKPRF